MADPDAIVRKQIDAYIEKLNELSNNAASKILECRDNANRDLLVVKEQAKEVVEKIDKAIRRHERQNIDISALADKAAVLQSRLDAVESILDDVQEKSEAIAGMVGKVVQIKSNPTLKMTAAAVEGDGRIRCVWMDGAIFEEAAIPFRALEISTLDAPGEVGAPDIETQEAPAKNPALDMPIESLGLTVRAQNCLLAAGVEKVGDVESVIQMMKLPNMGKRSVLEVQDRLRELGIEIPHYPPE